MRVVATIEGIGDGFYNKGVQVLHGVPDEPTAKTIEQALAGAVFDMQPEGDGGDEDLMVTLTCRSSGKGMVARNFSDTMEGVGKARYSQIRKSLAAALWDLDSAKKPPKK